MSTSFNILEWFYETINKRLGEPYNCKLEDLFCCIPYKDEAEFQYEILSIFKVAERRLGISQGAALERDYPNIAKLAKGNKTLKIRVFFIHPSRLESNLILWHKKYPYPKVSQVNGIKSMPFDLASTDTKRAFKEHLRREVLLNSRN